MANLDRGQGQAYAVERIDGVAGIADDVPAVRGIALAAFPHVGAVEIGVDHGAATNEFDEHRVFAADALEKLLHRMNFAVGVHVFPVRDADTHQRGVIRRTHRDVPYPIAFAEEMMSREVRNIVAVLFFERVDARQNLRIEIRQTKPEDVFLFLYLFVELQLFGEQPIAAGRVDEPARA